MRTKIKYVLIPKKVFILSKFVPRKLDPRDQGILQLKDSICFKSVQICSKEIERTTCLKWALVKTLGQRLFPESYAHLSSTSQSKAHSQGFYLHSHGSLIWHLSTLGPCGSRDLGQISMVVIPSPFALYMVSTTNVQHKQKLRAICQNSRKSNPAQDTK